MYGKSADPPTSNRLITEIVNMEINDHCQYQYSFHRGMDGDHFSNFSAKHKQ